MNELVDVDEWWEVQYLQVGRGFQREVLYNKKSAEEYFKMLNDPSADHVDQSVPPKLIYCKVRRMDAVSG